jgi:hypothetical protein
LKKYKKNKKQKKKKKKNHVSNKQAKPHILKP